MTENTNVKKHDKKIQWSVEQENLLIEWCDVAQCYKWLNSRSYSVYSRMHAFFTIPVIVFSTLTGTASFAQFSFPGQVQVYTPFIIGGITIFIGILSTVQQYLKITELKETYRISTILWDKYARNIRIELARIPKERMDAGNFLKLTRNEFDHLMETTPLIPTCVIKKFKQKFKGVEGSVEREIYDKLKKPDICDIIISVDNIRNKWLLVEEAKEKRRIDDQLNIDEFKKYNSQFTDIESNIN